MVEFLTLNVGIMFGDHQGGGKTDDYDSIISKYVGHLTGVQQLVYGHDTVINSP
jgi:hypothetical protein